MFPHTWSVLGKVSWWKIRSWQHSFSNKTRTQDAAQKIYEEGRGFLRTFKTMGYISIRLKKPTFFMKPKIHVPQSCLIKFSTFSSLGVLLGDQVIQIMIKCCEFTLHCLTPGVPTHLPRRSQNKTLEAALVGVVPWCIVYIMYSTYSPRSPAFQHSHKTWESTYTGNSCSDQLGSYLNSNPESTFVWMIMVTIFALGSSLQAATKSLRKESKILAYILRWGFDAVGQRSLALNYVK